MSKYTGPRIRKVRALGVDLPGLTRKSTTRRDQKPGQHGMGRRRRPSEYALRLHEKQKLRFNYGLNEKQLRRVVEEAKRSKTVTDQKIIELLESRVDNIVFRAGFAPTIPAARQMVNHGHFLLNNRKHNIPSARLKLGDELRLRDRSKELPLVVETLEAPSLPCPDWLSLDVKGRSVKLRESDGIQSPLQVDLQLVIEYYARA